MNVHIGTQENNDSDVAYHFGKIAKTISMPKYGDFISQKCSTVPLERPCEFHCRTEYLLVMNLKLQLSGNSEWIFLTQFQVVLRVSSAGGNQFLCS